MSNRSQRPKTFIVVLNWNGGEDTTECLASLDRLTYPNYQVLVVDNASSDGSAEVIRERFRDVHLIKNGKNLGFAGGNNIGIQYAFQRGADCVLLLNNDTIVYDKDFLDPLVDCVEQQGDSGIAGPMILYHQSSEIWSAGGRISWLTGFCRHVGKGLRADPWQGKKPYEVDYISGCALLLKRSVIEKVGLLDPNYFLYYEDVDLCFRATSIGIKCFVVPQSRIWHKLSSSAGYRGSDRLTVFQAYHFARNGILFAKKNLRSVKKTLFLSGQLSFRLAYGLLQCQDKNAFVAYFRGIWNGIRF